MGVLKHIIEISEEDFDNSKLLQKTKHFRTNTLATNEGGILADSIDGMHIKNGIVWLVWSLTVL